MSLIGFLFAAPGAVCIAGNMSKETNGRVSIAGPMVNIMFAAASLALCMVFNGSWLVVPFYLLASLNAFLAVFNLLPIPPLDGSKVLAWNKGVWTVAILIAAAELIALWMYVSPELYYIL
jgi:Zn-dependent protease